jgi:hypothetical protein
MNEDQNRNINKFYICLNGEIKNKNKFRVWGQNKFKQIRIKIDINNKNNFLIEGWN